MDSYINIAAQSSPMSLHEKLMGYNEVSPPDEIVDCDITSDVPSEGSVPCDDEYPDKTSLYRCGGWQVLSRTINVQANQYVVVCPELTRKRKCRHSNAPSTACCRAGLAG